MATGCRPGIEPGSVAVRIGPLKGSAACFPATDGGRGAEAPASPPVARGVAHRSRGARGGSRRAPDSAVAWESVPTANSRFRPPRKALPSPALGQAGVDRRRRGVGGARLAGSRPAPGRRRRWPRPWRGVTVRRLCPRLCRGAGTPSETRPAINILPHFRRTEGSVLLSRGKILRTDHGGTPERQETLACRLRLPDGRHASVSFY